MNVLRRPATLCESGDRQTLAGFLAEGARAREDQVRLVAQTLINILPDDDPERRLLEGFLAGRDVLPEVPRQERLFWDHYSVAVGTLVGRRTYKWRENREDLVQSTLPSEMRID